MENSQTSGEFPNQILSSTSLINLMNNTREPSNNSIEKVRKNTLSKIDFAYQVLSQYYCQKQFKKIVKTIKLKSDRVGKFFLSEWKLLHLRIFSLQKILDDKIKKYHKANKIPHFSNYLNDLNNDIDNWIILTNELILKEDTKYVKSFIEFIISFILKKCLILAKKYIHAGYVKYAIESLCLGVKLINDHNVYFSSPVSFFYSGEILLYLASFMISEKNYKTAKNLISLSIKFTYVSLELKLCNNNRTIFDLRQCNEEIGTLSKIFFNLSTAFYQLAVCNEQENDPYNAYYAIKTSNFFAQYSKLDAISLYQGLIKKIEKRLLMRNRIIIFFEKCVKKEELEDKIYNIKSSYKIMVSHEEKRQQRFEKLSKYLEGLKLVDVDDDEPDLFNIVGVKETKPSILKMTKHVKLLNYLMNDEFKDLVNKMKKIEINKPDKETINKISKRIIHIKNKEHYKLERNLKNQLSINRKLEERKNSILVVKKDKEESDEKLINNKNKFNCSKSNIFKSTSALTLPSTINKNNNRARSALQRLNQKILMPNNNKGTTKILTFRNSSQKNTVSNLSVYSTPSRYATVQDTNISLRKVNNTFRNKGLPTSSSMKVIFNPDSINYKTVKNKKKNTFKFSNRIKTPIYKDDKLALSKGFQKKYTFLENQFDQEIDFHKNLLRNKSIKEELEKPQSPNLKEINEKVNKFFYTTFYKELMNAKEKQIIFNKKEVNKKIKVKSPSRYQRHDLKIFKKIILGKDTFVDTEAVKEINDRYLNKMTKKIVEINNKKALFKKMQKY